MHHEKTNSWSESERKDRIHKETLDLRRRKNTILLKLSRADQEELNEIERREDEIREMMIDRRIEEAKS